MNLNSSGTFCSRENQTSPILRSLGVNHGSMRVDPQTLSRNTPSIFTGPLIAPLRRVLLCELFDAVEPARQFRQRGGIGDANVLIGAERLAGHDRHVRLLQQLLG